jgi:hypothetical protein
MKKNSNVVDLRALETVDLAEIVVPTGLPSYSATTFV